MTAGPAVDRVLKCLKGAKASGDGWMAICPGHDDKNPSLHVKQGARGAVVKCYAGCQTESVVEAMGLSMDQLFDDAGRRRPSRPAPPADEGGRRGVSVGDLARRFHLPEEYLRDEVGLRQQGGAVLVPYRGEDGSELLARRRVALEGKRKYLHPKGKPLSLYGLERLEAARAGKPSALMVVEGESDCWCLWRAGVAAVGVPGASAVRVVEAEHLRGISRVYIWQEPESAGEAFQLGLGQRLRDVGYAGDVRVIASTAAGCKDSAELWARGADEFRSALRDLIRGASEWDPVPLGDMVLRMDRVEEKQVRFLWQPYIPRGMVTVLAGKPGLGKSYLMAALSASISSGGDWPGNSRSFDPANVLLFAAEDDPEFVLRRRLRVGGADLQRVFAFDLLRHQFSFGGPAFGRLASLIDRLKPGLVVFDPVVSFTGARVNINRQNEVRGVLQPLVDVARRTGTPVVLVAHVSKGQASASAVDAIMGSVDFSAAPRSALVVYPDPNAKPGDSAGVLTHAKHNLSRSGPSLRFRIDEAERFTWLGESRMSAMELAGTYGTTASERSSMEEAKSFLAQYLAEGERPASEVTARARLQGISDTTLGRARVALGVESNRRGFGSDGSYHWRLPEEAHDAQLEINGPAPWDLK